MRGFLQLTATAACSTALVMFVMSGAGCNDKQASSPDHMAKPMSGDHDGHKHGAAEKDSGHDHSAHKHAAGEHKKASGDAAKIAQKTCPVMGEEIDPEVSMMHEGRKVYFCCEDCLPKFKKDPAKYLAKLVQAK